MALEPLRVDPERLAAAAKQLLAAANEMPTPPAPQTIAGGDPLSQAIAGHAAKVEAPVTEGLPALQKDAIRNAENVATAAKAYEDADRRLGDDINKRTFPEHNGQRGGSDREKAQLVGFGNFKTRLANRFPKDRGNTISTLLATWKHTALIGPE